MILKVLETRYGYCKCGCGQKTTVAPQSVKRHGYVKGEPRDYRAGHHNTHKLLSQVECVVDPITGCWEWQLRKNRKGYGVLDRGRMKLHNTASPFAHRAYYEKHKGPIPQGLVIDHLCRNPGCVNPADLEAVPPEVNTQRGINPKLTEGQVRHIRTSNERTSDLALKYGVSKSCIKRVRNGKTYQHWL